MILENTIKSFDLNELWGIFAGIFVLISFIPKKQILIRIINFIGCVLFIIYGVLKNAPSIYVVNTLLAIIQIVYTVLFFINYKKNKNIGYDYLQDFSALDKISDDKEYLKELEKVKSKYVSLLKQKDEQIKKLEDKINKEKTNE